MSKDRRYLYLRILIVGVVAAVILRIVIKKPLFPNPRIIFARRTLCQANMRVLGAGLEFYREEHDGVYLKTLGDFSRQGVLNPEVCIRPLVCPFADLPDTNDCSAALNALDKGEIPGSYTYLAGNFTGDVDPRTAILVCTECYKETGALRILLAGGEVILLDGSDAGVAMTRIKSAQRLVVDQKDRVKN